MRILNLSIPLAIVIAAGIIVQPSQAWAPFDDDTTPHGLVCVDTDGEICPSMSAMRAYRVSRMTDDEIRDARRAAEQEYENEAARARAEAAARVKKFGEQQRLCADLAYKTRNLQGCSWPLNWPHLGEPTIEFTVNQIFELHLLGICAHVRSAREAREEHCLPPR